VTRVYLHTFGCKANQYDTEVLRQALEGAGATAVDDPSQADLAVVNSCTVTHVSESKMRGFIRRIGRRNGCARTVVMGCAAELDDGTIASLPGVSHVVGGADPRRVLDALGLASDRVEPVLRTFERGTRAWLKIQDGCDEHCTFCATTLARGKNTSRSPEEIVLEASTLAGAHAEIVLTGVHIGTYGADRDDAASLSTLVEQLVTAVPRVRFRLSSIEATEIDDRLEEIMVGNPDRLAPHIHAPLQSGSDRLLKRMGRHWYRARTYRRRLESLAAKLPRFGLGADVMVGFPGETHADFSSTFDLLQDLPVTYLHVFSYSERAGTAATRLGSLVEPRVSRSRSAELRALATEKARSYRTRRDAGLADVVILSRSAGRYEGLTGDYLKVYLATDTVPPVRFGAELRLEEEMLLASPIREQ
jgi:threonylcarbamoyladenosine tRNA methylthiotransferase MtaB